MGGKKTAGAVNCVLPHPNNPNIMYIGAVNGGVWKTLNAQALEPKWIPLTDRLKSLSIGALAFDTADTNTIIAGIGRTSSFNYRGGPLTGLQLSTNSGDSFTELDGNGRLKGLKINGVVKHGNTILVTVNTADNLIADNVGVFQSIDNGLTFSQISVGDGTVTGMPAGRASSIIQDPENPTTLYASIYNTSNSIFNNNNSVSEKEKNGIYKSTNMGTAWTRISNTALEEAIDTNAINIKLAAGPSGTIFVAIVSRIDNSGKLSAVFRSGNGGETWQPMDLPTTTETKKDGNNIVVGIHPGGQGYAHLSFVADPSNPNIVYIGGDRQPNKFGAASNEKGIPSRYIKPDDNSNDYSEFNFLDNEDFLDEEIALDEGQPTVDNENNVNFPNSIGATTWSGRLFRGDASKATNQWVHLTHSNTLTNTAPHADSRSMAFDAAGNLIQTDNGGVYRRTNPTKNEGDWYSINGDLQVAEIHSIVYDPVTRLMTIGTQDNGTQRQKKSSSDYYYLFWTRLSSEILPFGGNGAVVALDNLANPGFSILYVSSQYLGDLTRVTINSQGTVIYSEKVELKLTNESDTFIPQFYSPLKVNPLKGGYLLIAGENSIFESSDKGDTLIDIGKGNPSLKNCSCISYGGPQNIIYACSKNKVVIRSGFDFEYDWMETELPFPGDDINNIIVDPYDYTNAFVVTKSNKVYMIDYGFGWVGWVDITGNLKNVGGIFSVNVIHNNVINNISSNLAGVVVGTEYGIYVSSRNEIGIWNKIGGNIPNVQISDLYYSSERDILAIGTLGRGAWVLKNVYSTLYGGSNYELIQRSSSIQTQDSLTKIKKSTTQISFLFNSTNPQPVIGSGFFYYGFGYDSDYSTDLGKGYFVTAAENVMKNIDGTIKIIETAYLQNPKTNQWKQIDTSKIVYDGIANIALIQTDIDFSRNPEYCLTVSNNRVNEGDVCYVVSNPSNYDEDSVSTGFVRSTNYCDKYGSHTVDSIFVSATTIGGYAGSPIVNKEGDVIGILTFNLGTESFNGGANAEVLLDVLLMLKKLLVNKENNTGHSVNNNINKLYLGMKWNVPSPFTIQKFYEDNTPFDTRGVYIEEVHENSPFHDKLKEGFLLLGFKELSDEGDVVFSEFNFGYAEDQRTPGVLFYYGKDTNIDIYFIDPNNKNDVQKERIILNKTYEDVDVTKDYMNIGAL